MWLARPDRDRANVHLAPIDMPAFLAGFLAGAGAGEGEHALSKGRDQAGRANDSICWAWRKLKPLPIGSPTFGAPNTQISRFEGTLDTRPRLSLQCSKSGPMRVEEKPEDFCPSCVHQLEIVLVKFGLTRTAMIEACPNCAMAAAEGSRQEQSLKPLFSARLKRWAERLKA